MNPGKTTMVETQNEQADNVECFVSRKRSFDKESIDNDNPCTTTDTKRLNVKQPLVKLLVPNYAAGAIIGKAGTNINDLQKKYGATIRISHNREFYPGTDERIVVLIGEINQILDFHKYIVDKANQDVSETLPENRRQVLRIVLPNSTAGIIIGRGGASIKALQESTKAKMMLTSRDESKVVGERVLSITGTIEQGIEAAKEVITMIAGDPDNMANSHLKYSHGSHVDLHSHPEYRKLVAGVHFMPPHAQNIFRNNMLKENVLSALPFNPISVPLKHPLNALNQKSMSMINKNAPPPPPELGGIGSAPDASALQYFGQQQQQMSDAAAQGMPDNSIKTTVQIEMEIPDVLIAFFVGIDRNVIHDYIKFSGARIQFVQMGDCSPGRKVLVIQGDLNQTQIAYYLVSQKLSQVKKELTSDAF